MENQNVEQVVEVTEVQEVKEQFPTDEMLKSMGISREEFDQKVEESKNMSFEERLAQIDDIQQKLKELEEQQIENDKQSKKNLQDATRLNLTLKLQENNLEAFDGLFDLEANEDKVEFLQNAVNQILVKHSYQPKEVAKQEQYTQAMEQGDVQKALGFKFSKLFGK